MEMRLMYAIGRAAELNGPLCLKDGKILAQLPNYTQIYTEPQKTVVGDVMCFAIVLPADKVVALQEEANKTIYRAWEGPKGNRGFASYKVQVEIYPLGSPIEDQTDGLLEKIGELNSELTDTKNEADKARSAKNEAEQRVMQLESALEDGSTRMAVLDKQLAKTRDELTRAQSGTVIRDVDVTTLAKVINQASDEVIMEMPYIAGENIVHVRKWAAEQLKV